MPKRAVVVSDRTGKILEDKDKVSVVIRTHPDLPADKAKVIEVHRFELSSLNCSKHEVRLEITYPDGTVAKVSCTAEEFDAFFSADKVAKAAWNHGRRPGPTPRAVSG